MAEEDISVLVSATSWIAGFTEKLVRALHDRGFSDEQIRSIVKEDHASTISKIAEVLLAEMQMPRISKTYDMYQLLLVGATALELVQLGTYGWHSDLITDNLFPLSPHEPVSRIIELIEFDHDPKTEEVLSDLARCGLERPTYEDALNTGAQRPEQQRKRPIVFLHEPVFASKLLVDSPGRVLVLDENVIDYGRVPVEGLADCHQLSSKPCAVRRMLLSEFGGHKWDRVCGFAGVRVLPGGSRASKVQVLQDPSMYTLEVNGVVRTIEEWRQALLHLFGVKE